MTSTCVCDASHNASHTPAGQMSDLETGHPGSETDGEDAHAQVQLLRLQLAERDAEIAAMRKELVFPSHSHDLADRFGSKASHSIVENRMGRHLEDSSSITWLVATAHETCEVTCGRCGCVRAFVVRCCARAYVHVRACVRACSHVANLALPHTSPHDSNTCAYAEIAATSGDASKTEEAFSGRAAVADQWVTD